MNVQSARSTAARFAKIAKAHALGNGEAAPKRRSRRNGGEAEIDRFRNALGPFVVAAEETRMAMAFISAAATGHKILFANDSFLALTGFASKEIVGQSFDFLMSRVASPEARDKIAAQFQQEDTETIEVECRHRDETPFLVAIRINPVHDKGGRIVQHCVSFVDLSEHVERIRKERAALHALYQHTPDFIVTMEGPDHRLSFANDAYLRLVGDRNLVGETLADAMPEVVGQGFIDLLDLVYETGEPFTGENVPVHLREEFGSAGALRYVDFSYQAVRDGDGKITGVFCEGHDVTEQNLAREQVRELRAEVTEIARASGMGTMAATLAHELNQPLTAISNYAGACTQLVEAVPPNADLLATAIKGIVESTARAGLIVRRLRNMTEGRSPHRELFDLGEAIRESIALVRASACPGVSIEDAGCGKVMLEADRVQIQQVIKNLVRNACEALGGTGGGSVVISTAAKGGRVVVSIQDNGPGVSPERAAHLFDWSDSAKADGMGIGLSICRTIVEAHRGKIWLESGGVGANFCFSVPLAARR